MVTKVVAPARISVRQVAWRRGNSKYCSRRRRMGVIVQPHEFSPWVSGRKAGRGSAPHIRLGSFLGRRFANLYIYQVDPWVGGSPELASFRQSPGISRRRRARLWELPASLRKALDRTAAEPRE